jgi:hypothetical protein
VEFMAEKSYLAHTLVITMAKKKNDPRL